MLGAPDYYRTPRGSQDIPHPRTIPDIISRSLFIQLCAALAYALLLNTLKQTSWSQVRSRSMPGPQWIWTLCSVLLPELILVQIGLWLIYKIFPCVIELIGTTATTTTRNRRRGVTRGVTSLGIGATLIQVLVLSLPLCYAFRGYMQRLGMRYHEATYVANLGLDHRNGWATISGLTGSAATVGLVLVSVMRAVLSRRIFDKKTVTKQSDHAVVGDEEEDFGYHGRTIYSHKPDAEERKESNDLSMQTYDQDHASFAGTLGGSSRLNFINVVNDLDAMLPLVLTALIHQILLAVTNRFPPLVAFFTTIWCILAIPVLCISFFLLPRSQRRVLWRVDALGKWTDLSFPVSVLLHNAMALACWLLIGSTVVVQLWCDVAELSNARAGHMQAWNYRWRVKDQFSHGDNDRVYMG